jgi:hypothetical protein
LNWVAPSPDWATAVDALDEALQPWQTAETEEAGIQALVGAPYSHLAEIAIQWGQRHNYAVIKPPTPQQILENDPQWLQQWEQNEAARLILPHLEHCYLRHHNGLDLIRRLLDWLRQRQRPTLLVSDSWAWRYLTLVHHVDALCRAPLTSAPLDAAALDQWLYYLANRDRPRGFTFRQEKDGKRILQRRPTPAAATPAHPSEFLRHLAARSRGISGVAWAIWRRSLQIAADQDTNLPEQKEAGQDHGVTIWVTTWDELQLPELANSLSHAEAFVLHNLLLHNGLSDTTLALLLPGTSADLVQTLRQLQSAGLIERQETIWRVAAVAYAAVRHTLRSEGYLTDEL